MNDKKQGGSRPHDIPIAENLFGAEIYADNAAFFVTKGGNVSIAFSSLRLDHSSSPGTAKHVIIGRLVMPITGAQGLAVGLYDFLKQNGLAPDQSKTN